MKTYYIMLASLFFLLAGCSIGNTVKDHRNVTLGQELLDLYEAKKRGILKDEEYEILRDLFISGYERQNHEKASMLAQ